MTHARHWLTTLVAGSLLFSGQAFAHAHVSSANPADGARIASPTSISLTFSEGLELPFSGLGLSRVDGNPVSLGDATLDNGGKTLNAPVSKTLDAGKYAVKWHVLSTDGHKTEGQYQFTVTP